MAAKPRTCVAGLFHPSLGQRLSIPDAGGGSTRMAAPCPIILRVAAHYPFGHAARAHDVQQGAVGPDPQARRGRPLGRGVADPQARRGRTSGTARGQLGGGVRPSSSRERRGSRPAPRTVSTRSWWHRSTRREMQARWASEDRARASNWRAGRGALRRRAPPVRRHERGRGDGHGDRPILGAIPVPVVVPWSFRVD